jgi:hypothetical protein
MTNAPAYFNGLKSFWSLAPEKSDLKRNNISGVKFMWHEESKLMSFDRNEKKNQKLIEQ